MLLPCAHREHPQPPQQQRALHAQTRRRRKTRRPLQRPLRARPSITPTHTQQIMAAIDAGAQMGSLSLVVGTEPGRFGELARAMRADVGSKWREFAMKSVG